jgi:uncharacterized protein (TIGR02145 family)
MAEVPHHLRIFLCHSSGDRQAVRDLYNRLCADGYNPWLDVEDLVPGQDWQYEISCAISNADLIIVCLSKASINKAGYVQREIREALDVALEQPDNAIFLIPLRLDECEVPKKLSKWQWVNYFEVRGYDRLKSALNHRAKALGKGVLPAAEQKESFSPIQDAPEDTPSKGVRGGRPFKYALQVKAATAVFTDPRDGHKYKIVQLRDGNWWLAENLRYDIPGSYPADENPDESILATNPDYDWRRYGRLYTWEAAKKAIPPGWHLPSDREWKNMLKLYGGYAPLHGKIDPTGRNDLVTLIRDELDVEFGGHLDTADYPNNTPSPPYYYGYFGGFMGGRFWTSKRPLFDKRSALYYLFFLHTDGREQSGAAMRSQENDTKAFSVRCVRGSRY